MSASVSGPLLHAAVRRNDFDSVQTLTENDGVDIDCVYYGSTPLLLAIQQGYTDLTNCLCGVSCLSFVVCGCSLIVDTSIGCYRVQNTAFMYVGSMSINPPPTIYPLNIVQSFGCE